MRAIIYYILILKCLLNWVILPFNFGKQLFLYNKKKYLNLKKWERKNDLQKGTLFICIIVSAIDYGMVW